MFLPPIEPPANLLEKILHRIHALRLRSLRRRLLGAAVGIVGSILYTVLNWPALQFELQQSSLFNLLRLFISDPDILFTNLKDLALGLLEIIPLETLLLGLISCFFIIAIAFNMTALRHERRSLSIFTH